MREGNAKGSQLIIYPDGTLYHIDLKRADSVPANIFFVGAKERVDAIAHHFDSVRFRHQNKVRPEFYAIAGMYKGVPMTAFSCGIGVDNIEIVLTEFHALFEYDHTADRWSDVPKKVNIIRVGTAGTSLKELPIGAIAISKYSLGLDNLCVYYAKPIQRDATAEKIEQAFLKTSIGAINPLSYCSTATAIVAETLEKKAQECGEKFPMIVSGITTASPGFFAPEGRSIGRIKTALSFDAFISDIAGFNECGFKIVNHEMETSGLFRIGNELLGYNVGAICLILDNLASDEMIEKKRADERMEKCIYIALESMVELANEEASK
ncbi:MAG: hypothetical protein AAB362_01045 [Patescibacteria group bacterium]